MRSATTAGVSTSSGPRSRTPSTIVLPASVAQHLRVEIGLRGLEREVRRGARVELGEERIAGQPVLDDVRIAEAGVEHGVAVDALERAIDRLDGVLARLLRARLEVRLVDLDDVGARQP